MTSHRLRHLRKLADAHLKRVQMPSWLRKHLYEHIAMTVERAINRNVDQQQLSVLKVPEKSELLMAMRGMA